MQQSEATISDNKLQELVFNRFDTEIVAQMSGKDERTAARWKNSKKLPADGRTALLQIANAWGLGDPEIRDITKQVDNLAPAKQKYFLEVMENTIKYRAKQYPTVIDETIPAPQNAMLKLLRDYHSDKKFDEIVDVCEAWTKGVEFAKLEPDERARALFFFGCALNRITSFPRAKHVLLDALKITKHKSIQLNLKMELSVTYDMGYNDFEEAKQILDSCYKEHSDDELLIYNLMCLHARHSRIEDVDKYAEELQKINPSSDDPNSSLGKMLRTDPDLESYRNTIMFKERFKQMSKYFVYSLMLFVVYNIDLISVLSYVSKG